MERRPTFHTYVLNAHAVPIDIDRALRLMDKAIVRDLLRWLDREAAHRKADRRAAERL